MKNANLRSWRSDPLPGSHRPHVRRGPSEAGRPPPLVGKLPLTGYRAKDQDRERVPLLGLGERVRFGRDGS